LVVGEVAIAVLLLTGAGLLVKSFWRLLSADAGFDGTGVASVLIGLPGSRYDSNTKIYAFFEELRERAAALPGVESAAITSHLPLTGPSYTSDFAVQGRGREDYGSEINHRAVSPEYFGMLRQKLVRGRLFTAADRADSPPVVLLNEAVVRRFFAGQDPVGQRISFDKYPDSTSTWYTIVGIIADARQYANEPARIEAFHPYQQDGGNYMSLAVRTAGDPTTVYPMLRGTVKELDPQLAVISERSMEQIETQATARERFMMALLGLFAGVALVLAIVGVYGVTAQAARERTQEIGIRLALGARGNEVLSLVLRQGMLLICGGLVIGVAAGLLATKAMTSLLYETAPGDPIIFVGVAAALALAGLVASWLPARRASRVDPAVALRT
jgi:putative ABC transport system permease protein